MLIELETKERREVLPRSLFEETAESISKSRERSSLDLFHAMSVRVPAYKDFLRREGIRPESVRTNNDLRQVPSLNKKNYLRQYDMAEMCWDGRIDNKRLTYTCSSGSTGEPCYFPRDTSLDEKSTLIFELSLRAMSGGKMPSTLFIVSFGMGIWIGGVISYQSIRNLSERGYPISVITPGSNKKEIFEVLRKVAPKYDQVVLGGYPPFVKDVLDEAPEHGFDPAKTPLKVFCAAEGFSEGFRDHVMERAGGLDPLFDTTNQYGTADLGTMSIETPVSIALRREAVQNPGLYGELFGKSSKLPTLAQFHPSITDFTAEGGELLASGGSAMPLVRYELGDRGGVIDYDLAISAAERECEGFSEKRAEAIAATPRLPFVYVYERNDFSVKLYGAIIYAEHVRAGLESSELRGFVTGKFSMSVEHDKNHDQNLVVQVEACRGAELTPELSERSRRHILESLTARNAEYKNSLAAVGSKAKPVVKLRENGDPKYFRHGVKQRWVNPNI